MGGGGRGAKERHPESERGETKESEDGGGRRRRRLFYTNPLNRDEVKVRGCRGTMWRREEKKEKKQKEKKWPIPKFFN